MRGKILKILGLILIYIAISLGVYFVLCACGLDSVASIRDFVSGVGVWGYAVFFLFQVTAHII